MGEIEKIKTVTYADTSPQLPEQKPQEITIKRKKYKIMLDDVIYKQLHAAKSDPKAHVKFNHAKIKNWIKEQVKKNPELIDKLEQLFNDCYHKNLSGIFYDGEFNIEGIDPPVFEGLYNIKEHGSPYIKEHPSINIRAIDFPQCYTEEHKKEIHPDAALFPYMPWEDFASLIENIRENGQLETIKVLDEKIIDGRNRYKACMYLQLIPRFEHVEDVNDTLKYVLSANSERRHLDTTQRAWIAAKLYFRSVESEDDHKSQSDAANHMNVSLRSLASARKVYTKACERLVQEVEYGQIAISTAADMADFTEDEQLAVLNCSHKQRKKLISLIAKNYKSLQAPDTISVSFGKDETAMILDVHKSKSPDEIKALLKVLILKDCERLMQEGKADKIARSKEKTWETLADRTEVKSLYVNSK